MSIEKITAYRTTDRRVHEDEDHAAAHQAELDVREWVEDAGICRGGPWDASMVADALLHDAAELSMLLVQAAGSKQKVQGS